MSQQTKRSFTARPDHLIADFRQHLEATGEPHTWRFNTLEPPPPDGIEVLVANFLLPRGSDRAPCPICRREKQYLKGHLLWSPPQGTLHTVGHCCGHHYFRDDSLAVSLKDAAERTARRGHEAFLWANWELPAKLTGMAENLSAQARSYDRVVKALKAGLTTNVAKAIHRMATEGGYLQVVREVETPSSLGGLRAATEPFGDRPIQGGQVLKVGRSNSLEGHVRASVVPFSLLDWSNEDDAVLWLCSQPSSVLKQLRDWLLIAVATLEEAQQAIVSLTHFVEPEHLEMLSRWSALAHGENAFRLFIHADGSLAVWRGHERVRTILLPRNLWEVDLEPIVLADPKEANLG